MRMSLNGTQLADAVGDNEGELPSVGNNIINQSRNLSRQ